MNTATVTTMLIALHIVIAPNKNASKSICMPFIRSLLL